MRLHLSHAPEDVAFVRRLTEYLWTVGGVEPRRDSLRAPETPNSAKRLGHELRRYDFIIVVLSQAYVGDHGFMNVLLQSLVREEVDQRKFILPVLIEDCEVPFWLRDRVIDFRNVPFNEAAGALAATLAGPRQVFVVMKFGDPQLDSTYAIAIRPAVEKAGFTALRIDEVENAGSITDQMLQQIERSAVVLADLTGERPNCYFEAGYAHALGKQLILSIRKGEKVHFNLADRRFIEWGTEKELLDALQRRLESIRATMPDARGLALAAKAGG